MRGRVQLILIVTASALLVAGSSYALKKYGSGRYGGGPVQYAAYERPPVYARPGGGCNSSGGGCASSSGAGRSSCCGGSGSAGKASNVEQVKAGAIEYYASKYGDRDVTCEVKDYGCHMEAEILKNGTVIKKLSISGGTFTEIG